MQTFEIFYDCGYEGYVITEITGAYSFARVPINYNWLQNTKHEARIVLDQIKRDANLGIIKTRMIETPDRFESVCDDKYGCAWE